MLLLVHGRGGQREAVGDLELGGDIGTDKETSGRSRECACCVLDDAHDHEGLDLDLAQRRGGIRSSRHVGDDQVGRFDLKERCPGMGVVGVVRRRWCRYQAPYSLPLVVRGGVEVVL